MLCCFSGGTYRGRNALSTNECHTGRCDTRRRILYSRQENYHFLATIGVRTLPQPNGRDPSVREENLDEKRSAVQPRTGYPQLDLEHIKQIQVCKTYGVLHDKTNVVPIDVGYLYLDIRL